MVRFKYYMLSVVVKSTNVPPENINFILTTVLLQLIFLNYLTIHIVEYFRLTGLIKN